MVCFTFLKCHGAELRIRRRCLKVGDTLKVLIKDIQGEKIALSLKFPETNPWLTAADKYAVGNVVEGNSCTNDRLWCIR